MECRLGWWQPITAAVSYSYVVSPVRETQKTLRRRKSATTRFRRGRLWCVLCIKLPCTDGGQYESEWLGKDSLGKVGKQTESRGCSRELLLPVNIASPVEGFLFYLLLRRNRINLFILREKIEYM